MLLKDISAVLVHVAHVAKESYYSSTKENTLVAGIIHSACNLTLLCCCKRLVQGLVCFAMLAASLIFGGHID